MSTYGDLIVNGAMVAILAPLAALLVVVVVKLLTGGIRTRGMLHDKEEGGFSPARVQVLLFGGVVIADYIASVSISLHNGSLRALPELDQSLLTMLGGSQSLYLIAKSRSLLSVLIGRSAIH